MQKAACVPPMRATMLCRVAARVGEGSSGKLAMAMAMAAAAELS